MYLRLPLLYILLLLSFSSATAQELTIYIMPAPKGVNWESPRRLILSYIGNLLVSSPYQSSEKHPIGHVVVELKDSNRYALVGTTATSNRFMMHKVMHRGWAAGILFATVDGTLEEEDINLPQLTKRKGNGEIAFVNYKINKAVFERLWKYLQEYKQRGYGKYYNGKNKPREGEGAGCSSFAYSFLEVGGLNHFLDSKPWIIHIAIQESLIGGPETDGRRVSIFTMLVRGRWANIKRNRYRNLDIYEPTFMFNNINYKWLTSPDTGTISRSMYGKAKGLTIDARNIAPPDEPIWLNDINVQ
jgi:hypothetical protein